MASKQKPAAATEDAIKLLMQDHKRVKGLFEEFQKFQDADQEGYETLKQELMDAVCSELKIHAAVEEEIFYPAARGALPNEEDLLNEAEVEHAGAKDLIRQIECGSASDPMTCARFTVLGEQIDHHVGEEEGDMFPKVRKSKLDLERLGRKMAARKEELKAEMGITPFDEEGDDGKTGEKVPSLWERLRSMTGTSRADGMNGR